MRTSIAVRGAGSHGKSSSIKKAYQLLRESCPTADVNSFVEARVDIRVIIAINVAKLPPNHSINRLAAR